MRSCRGLEATARSPRSKVLQFYEAGLQRMGVGIVGPCGCGKSTIWQVCRQALAQMKQQIVKSVMNPKSRRRGSARKGQESV